ncbi:MAG: ATP-binding cassette domain-containing protein [Clostridia bacterium]|nr:ATP-binding cassette domain-containing protein [Clostridia bacterium]
MINVSNLTKKYGNHTAVDNVSFHVKQGEVLGFLGPNGAGKTTIMNIITGYISCTEGDVKLDGFDVVENPLEVKKSIGYLPEKPPLYMDMTVEEYLKFVSQIKGVALNDQKSQIDRVLELLKIGEVNKRLIKNLSKGYKQRVGFAQALIGQPKVLILDEPTVGLDPKQIIEIRNLIKQLGKEHTVILSSHILPEISAVCERVIIIDQGKLVATDTPQNLSSMLGNSSRLDMRIEGPEEQVVENIKSIEGVIQVEVINKYDDGCIDLIVESDKQKDIRRQLFYQMSEKRFPILKLNPLNLTLEEIFLKLTTREEGEL